MTIGPRRNRNEAIDQVDAAPGLVERTQSDGERDEPLEVNEPIGRDASDDRDVLPRSVER